MNKSAKESILAVDIGNTRIKMAIVKGDEVLAFTAIPTKEPLLESRLLQFDQWCKSNITPQVKVGLVSSVVNDVTPKVHKFLLKYLPTVKVIGRDWDLIVSTEYSRQQIGMDIFCKGAYLANKGMDYVCLDSGTATVITYIKDGVLTGGGITLGYRGFYKALKAEAPALPLLEPVKASAIFGHDTKSAIEGANYFGYVSLLEGLVRQATLETNCKNIIFTGGFSFLFSPVVKFQHKLDQELLLKGIYLIYQKNKSLILQ